MRAHQEQIILNPQQKHYFLNIIMIQIKNQLSVVRIRENNRIRLSIIEKTMKQLPNRRLNSHQQTGVFFIYGNEKYDFCDTGVSLHRFNRERQLHGKQYFLYLSGIKISANFCRGFIQKWMIGLCGTYILCHYFHKSKRQGKQYYYEKKQRLLITSVYKHDQLIKVQEIQSCEFQEFLEHNEGLSHEINELVGLHVDRSIHQAVDIDQFTYFGSLHKELNVPHGLGLLYHQNEMYAGEFNQGFLDGLGSIRFPAHVQSYYYGYLENGKCAKYGCYHQANQVTYYFNGKKVEKPEFVHQLRSQSLGQRWGVKFPEIHKFFCYLYDNLRTVDSDNCIQQKTSSISSPNIEIRSVFSKAGKSQSGDEDILSPLNAKKRQKIFLQQIPQLNIESLKAKGTPLHQIKMSRTLKTQNNEQQIKDYEIYSPQKKPKQRQFPAEYPKSAQLKSRISSLTKAKQSMKLNVKELLEVNSCSSQSAPFK